jgi:glycosyltransferase involved in cell wall biosynthesis
MKILQIGHEKSIEDSTAWGAIELLIKNYHAVLSLEHNSRYIPTSRGWFEEVERFKPNIIISHNEKTLKKLALYKSNSCKIYFISHYAYIKEMYGISNYFKPKNLSEFYLLVKLYAYNNLLKRKIQSGLGCGVILPIVLDRRLLQLPVFRNAIYMENYLYADVNAVKISQHNNKIICIGKIEIRKQQSYIQNIVGNVDFYGPVVDKKFDTLKRYYGEVRNNELHSILPNYMALLLFSLADLKPLVVIEALMCGVPVVVNRELLMAFNSDYGLLGIDNLSDLNKINFDGYDRIKIKNEARFKYDLRKNENVKMLLDIFNVKSNAV